MAVRLRVTREMFARDAAQIRRAAIEVDRQAMFYERNGPPDVLRFLLIGMRAGRLENSVKRALRRYEAYRKGGWD